MESTTNCTIPVTLRHAQIGDDGSYKVLFFEESLGPEGVNKADFPKGWRGDSNWKELKRKNFARMLGTPGKTIDIEVDHRFTLVRIADETNEYFINSEEDEDVWGSFAVDFNTTSTTSTTSTNNKKKKEEDKYIALWDNETPSKKEKARIHPILTEPSPGFGKKKARVSFVHEPVSLCIGISKGTSNYKKILPLTEESTYATIDFFSRLMVMHPDAANILQSMLQEFDDKVSPV